MKRIVFILLLTIPIIGFGQGYLVIPQPECKDLEGKNFDELEWTEIDGTNHPNFPKNGIVKMCNDEGYVTLEMLFVDGKNERDRYWEDWGMKLRHYYKDVWFDMCFDKKGEQIDCKQ